MSEVEKGEEKVSPVDSAIKDKENAESHTVYDSVLQRIPLGNITSGAKSLLSTVNLWSGKSTTPTIQQASNNEEHVDLGDEDIAISRLPSTSSSLPNNNIQNSQNSYNFGNRASVIITTPRPSDLPKIEAVEPIRSRSKNKSKKDFDKLYLSQTLIKDNYDLNLLLNQPNAIKPKPAPIWTFKFSRDGEYLASGSQDGTIRIYGLRLLSDEDFNLINNPEVGLKDGWVENFPIFTSKPIRTFIGHTSDVLDLSWSKTGFLLSSSTDRTVKLWHVGRSECLCSYLHSDFVTSVAFHPKNDRFFLSGSLDCKLRLWNIPEKKVAVQCELPDGHLVTAVGFCSDGRTAIAGSYHGLCLFYEAETLTLRDQFTVKSGSRTRNVVARKITGIESIPGQTSDQNMVMITSNDSKIRIYNIKDKSLEYKFKGPENNSNQIKASYSDDQRYIVCGSENKQVYIFDFNNSIKELRDKKNFQLFKKKEDEHSYETLDFHTSTVTYATLASTKTKIALAKVGDPVFNPNFLDVNDPQVQQLIEENHILVSADYMGNLKVMRTLPPSNEINSQSNSTFSSMVNFGFGNKSFEVNSDQDNHSFISKVSRDLTRSLHRESRYPNNHIKVSGGRDRSNSAASNRSVNSQFIGPPSVKSMDPTYGTNITIKEALNTAICPNGNTGAIACTFCNWETPILSFLVKPLTNEAIINSNLNSPRIVINDTSKLNSNKNLITDKDKDFNVNLKGKPSLPAKVIQSHTNSDLKIQLKHPHHANSSSPQLLLNRNSDNLKDSSKEKHTLTTPNSPDFCENEGGSLPYESFKLHICSNCKRVIHGL